MDHCYRFKRGDRVTIIYGKFAGSTGIVDSLVFQKTVRRARPTDTASP